MNLIASYSEKELLVKLTQGDHMAFQAVFTAYFDRIYSVALRYCKIHAAAEDITQQVFLRLWTNRASLAEVKNFPSWILTVARNLVLDYLRAQARNDTYLKYIQEVFSEEQHSPEQLLILRQQGDLLKNSLGTLTAKQLEVYSLHREAGLTYSEIAQKLGIGHATVKDHMAKALEKIRQFIQNHQGELLVFLLIITAFIYF